MKLNPKQILIGILIWAFLFRLILVFTTPHLNASDELGNLNYQKAVCQLNFPILPVDKGWAGQFNQNQYLHGPVLYLSAYPLCPLQRLGDESYLHFLRIYDVILATVTIYLVYLIGALIFPRRPEIAISAAAFAAGLPAFANKGATFNVDTISYLLITLALYFLIKWLTQHPALKFKHLLALAVLLALTLLTKSYGIFLLPLYLLFALLYDAKNWRVWAGVGLSIIAGIALALPWLYFRNYVHYGDLLATSIDWGKPSGTYLEKLQATWDYFRVTFWAVFSFNNGLKINPALNNVFWWVLAIVGVGFVGFFIKLKETALKYSFYLLFLVMLMSAYGAYHWGMINNNSQARYFFPAIAGLSLVVACGWDALFPSRLKRYAFPLLVLALLALDIGILAWIIPVFAVYEPTGPWTQSLPLPN